MKMKRFIAAGAHQAMEQVNDALGPDALILSTRKVSEGVEIIAAVDYEDELLSSVPVAAEIIFDSASYVEPGLSSK